jgi:hypothetical protein
MGGEDRIVNHFFIGTPLLTPGNRLLTDSVSRHPRASKGRRRLKACSPRPARHQKATVARRRASLTDLSLFITMVLAFVGTSPDGTGGGAKTGTLKEIPHDES